MDLELEHYSIQDNIAVITAVGEVDVYTAPRLRELVIKLVKAGHIWLVLDISEVEYLDSTGLGVVTGAFKRTRAKRGGLALVASQERVMKIFRITGLVKVFRIFDNAQTAIATIVANPIKATVTPAYSLAGVTRYIDIDGLGWSWFPARIYISKKSAGAAVQRGLYDLLDALGIEVAFEFAIRHGSWYREFIVRLQEPGSLSARKDILASMHRTLEQQAAGPPPAKRDSGRYQPVEKLFVALDRTRTAIVQSGSVLLVKVRDSIIVRNVGEQELVRWEQSPELFRDPEKALHELQHGPGAVTPREPRRTDAS